VSKSTISLLQLFNAYPDEESARVYFEGQRWPDGPCCPACGVIPGASQAGQPNRHRGHPSKPKLLEKVST
jgi:hypothetical protein